MIKLPSAEITSLLKAPLDFFSFFDEIPLGVIVFDLDRHIVYFNGAFEALTGFSLNSAYGVPCRHILRSRACVTDCPCLAVKEDNRSKSLESDIINLDRQRIPVRITHAPIHNTLGETTGYLGTIEDLRIVQKLNKKISPAYSFANIIGRSPQMERIFQTLPVLAQSDASILITGETGTGKDLVAEAVHDTSNRASGSFIKINCGALPETLLESEIFGHVKGAFTGAVENKPGRFRLAHNGTIFLTEIGDLPLSLQVKLLTFLDDKIIFPLGSTKGFNANVRIIAATHRDLEKMVHQGSFRQDLLFRLNVARVHLPPLREREGDIRLLLDHFFSSYVELLGKEIRGFSTKALEILLSYEYRGNIRELKNIVEYAVNISTGPVILPDHLPAYLFDPCPERIERKIEFKKAFDTDGAPDTDNELTASMSGLKESTPRTWQAAERQMIMDALIRARGKKNRAAKILGWGRSTLWRKIKQYGIEDQQEAS
ncbi:MAG: sigma 54-interacting transcriptional regulator [Desulfobacteraceae bacterium]